VAIPASITNYLNRAGVSYDVIEHPLAYTAQEEAAVSHVPGPEWAKAVVCIADEKPVLAVLPAHYHLDMRELRNTLGAKHVRLASEAEIEPLYEDCEVGAMPPLGPLYGQRVLVDRSLTSRPSVVFNAGSHRDAIRMNYKEFDTLVRPVVATFAAPPVIH
jgi:Ala-tRNA(Pro) deacylase